MARSPKSILMSFAPLIGTLILAGSRVEASGLYGITVLDPGTTHGLLLDPPSTTRARWPATS